jgi:Zn finger protein HypA/HybF involved in hydrogenase expression
MTTERARLGFGTTVYADDGTEIGRIRGLDENGVSITLREGIEGLSVEHVRSGQTFSEAELMWRCWECGELGRLDRDVPDECPNCGADREDLSYWTED